jgi:hypothetical protein
MLDVGAEVLIVERCRRSIWAIASAGIAPANASRAASSSLASALAV